MAGMVLEQVYKPSIPPSEYPVVNTRPISSMVHPIPTSEGRLFDHSLGYGSRRTR